MQVSVRMTDELASWLDEYGKEEGGLPSRPEVIRRIIIMRRREWQKTLWRGGSLAKNP